jgi:hypothetical protein
MGEGRSCVHKNIGRNVPDCSLTTPPGPSSQGWKDHEIDEAKRILLRQGRKRFGRAKVDIKARIEALSDLNRLEQLVDRVLDATSWDDLIGES